MLGADGFWKPRGDAVTETRLRSLKVIWGPRNEPRGYIGRAAAAVSGCMVYKLLGNSRQLQEQSVREHTCPDFYMGAGDPNLGPHACEFYPQNLLSSPLVGAIAYHTQSKSNFSDPLSLKGPYMAAVQFARLSGTLLTQPP